MEKRTAGKWEMSLTLLADPFGSARGKGFGDMGREMRYRGDPPQYVGLRGTEHIRTVCSMCMDCLCRRERFKTGAAS